MQQTTGEKQCSPDLGAAALVDVKQVAAILQCSPRHVYRLVNEGMMPRPVKLGALVRFDYDSLLTWIRDGCNPIGQMKEER